MHSSARRSLAPPNLTVARRSSLVQSVECIRRLIGVSPVRVQRSNVPACTTRHPGESLPRTPIRGRDPGPLTSAHHTSSRRKPGSRGTHQRVKPAPAGIQGAVRQWPFAELPAVDVDMAEWCRCTSPRGMRGSQSKSKEILRFAQDDIGAALPYSALQSARSVRRLRRAASTRPLSAFGTHSIWPSFPGSAWERTADTTRVNCRPSTWFR
jgi:hypothetical protein